MSVLSELRSRIRHRGDQPCQQVVELVTDYVEGALAEPDARRFERHLHNCADCTRYVEQVRLTSDTLGRVHPSPPDGDTREALLQAFRDFRDGGSLHVTE